MYRLVIIDDEEKILDGMGNLFPWEQIGFTVVGQFVSARQALAFIETNEVDVVLTDIEMPDLSGVELSGALLQYENIQTVLFSSYSHHEYFRAALRNGVVDYLMKPVQYAALLECFEKVKARLDAKRSTTQAVPKAYYEQIVDKVLAYLGENYRNASLEQASATVNLSPAYLSRIFKEKNGVSFSEMILKIRMEKAKEMLADSSYKSYDIAYYVGYDNPKNFSRAFKAYCHMSPMEYRKAKLGGDGAV